jgi:hypothetical protein
MFKSGAIVMYNGVEVQVLGRNEVMLRYNTVIYKYKVVDVSGRVHWAYENELSLIKKSDMLFDMLGFNLKHRSGEVIVYVRGEDEIRIYPTKRVYDCSMRLVDFDLHTAIGLALEEVDK